MAFSNSYFPVIHVINISYTNCMLYKKHITSLFSDEREYVEYAHQINNLIRYYLPN